jgi:pSer/pThr/pTyr-binding forkhead associated (FHA) protein
MIAIEVPWKGRVEVPYCLRVGREGAWADLVLDYRGVSRHHLEIRADGRGYRVFDMGSSNGTRVNGKLVSSSGRVLSAGDEIGLADEVAFEVISISPPPSTEKTKKRDTLPTLAIELERTLFMVTWRPEPARAVRDSMPFQLGLALSVLALFRIDGLGPVSDPELRAIVWRGDEAQMESGDLNRLLLRLRKWFRDRESEPPPIERPKGSGTTQLAEGVDLELKPEGWLYPYLDQL